MDAHSAHSSSRSGRESGTSRLITWRMSTWASEQDNALDALEAAYDERAGSLYGIKGSFLFTTLRSHPRFRALLKKMNLDEGKTDES